MVPTARLNLGPGARLGSYEITREIGRGGMSIVYEAKHVVLGKRAALKVLSSGALSETRAGKRFLREARIVAQLEHPHIVEAFDFGEVDGNPYLIMEILDGRDLAVILQRKGRLALPELVEIFVPILSAVSSAHTAGVIHRDLKPSNVSMPMRGGRMHPKVVDFGISKVLTTPGIEAVTHDDTILGTPQYLSPELTRGAANASPASDQYALGVMLYECATGQLPFQGKSAYEVMHAIVTSSPPPPSTLVPSLPAAFDAIVARAMERDPANRFPSVHALATALTALGDSGTQATWGAEFLTPATPLTPPGESTLEEHDGRSSVAPRAFSVEETVPRVRAVRRALVIASAAVLVGGIALYAFSRFSGHNAKVATAPSTSGSASANGDGSAAPLGEAPARDRGELATNANSANDAPRTLIAVVSAAPDSPAPPTPAPARSRRAPAAQPTNAMPAQRASASSASAPASIGTATPLTPGSVTPKPARTAPAAGPNGAPILE